jgi:hypothetical protein
MIGSFRVERDGGRTVEVRLLDSGVWRCPANGRLEKYLQLRHDPRRGGVFGQAEFRAAARAVRKLGMEVTEARVRKLPPLPEGWVR